jgi:tetratricopeptide (TPR) repeat protein
MAVSGSAGRVTATDDLRELLSQSEARLITLSGAASVAELYGWLDQIANLLPQIQATGANIRPEEARWQSLEERIRSRSTKVLRAWQGNSRLEAARQAVRPAESHWWWWIDRMVSDARQRRLRRLAGITVAALLIIVVASLVLQRLFPVDPVVRESYRLQMQAEAALNNRDLAAAYQALTQAVEVDPESASLLILHGVVAYAQGDTAAADQSWQRARTLLDGDEAVFLTERGRSYLRVQQSDRAVEDLETALVLDPASARTHLLLGSALEAAGRLEEALAAYEQAASLADAAGNAELVVMARAQLANLIQRIPMAPSSSPQP